MAHCGVWRYQEGGRSGREEEEGEEVIRRGGYLSESPKTREVEDSRYEIRCVERDNAIALVVQLPSSLMGDGEALDVRSW